MITSSIVLYKTAKDELNTVVSSVLDSCISFLYLIDNSPNRELESFVAKFDKKRVFYVFNDRNLGYGAGHNIAIREAIRKNACYHIVLNPDIKFKADAVTKICEYMNQNPDVGQVMPKILYSDGNIQYLCKLLPSPMDLFGRRFIPIKKYKEKRAYKYELHAMGYDKIMEIPVLSGCFMFMRVDVLKKVGGFDERFFMYSEDVDLCRRIGEVSKTMFYPMASVYHGYEKGSYKSWKLLKYHICSAIQYFNKWGWVFDKKRIQRNKEFLDALSQKK